MQPAARFGDSVEAVDAHLVQNGPAPVIQMLPFKGRISLQTCPSVRIDGVPAAAVGSVAVNAPPHIPIGGPFAQPPPSNLGTVIQGSATVRICGMPAARLGDAVRTCNFPVDLPVGTITSGSPSVRIG